jgi:hypothetical protein
MQRWRFLVSRDPKIKQTVGAYYKRAWDEQVAPRYQSGEPAPGMSRERFLRLLDAAEYLAAHIHEAPVWIISCLEGGTPTRTSGSSIYPAVQKRCSNLRERSQVRRGLAAGGSRIRTLGPPAMVSSAVARSAHSG